MSAEIIHHKDCKNFAPVDVVKGICHLSKELIMADGEGCNKCVPLPKCKFCGLFSLSQEPHLGTCLATPQKFMAYPEMTALTCSWFVISPKDLPTNSL